MTNFVMNKTLADAVAVRLNVSTISPSNTASAVTSPKTASAGNKTGGQKRPRAPEASQHWPASVGKRPPRDMKRLDQTTWYSIIRTAKWGDTPALFLSPSQDKAKIIDAAKAQTETLLKKANGEFARNSEEASGASKNKGDEGGFFKPPRNYFEFNFQVGDRVKLVAVGYSNSRNKVATDITVDTNGRFEPIPSAVVSPSTQGEGDRSSGSSSDSINANKRQRINALQSSGLLGRIPPSAPSNLMGFSPALAAAASSICNQPSNRASSSRPTFGSQFVGSLSPRSFSQNGANDSSNVYALLAHHAMIQRRNADELKLRLAIAKIRQQQQQQRQHFHPSPPMNQNALEAALQSLKTRQLNSAIFNILKNGGNAAASHASTPPMMFSSRAGSPTITPPQLQYQQQSSMTNGSRGGSSSSNNTGFGF